MSVVAPTEHDLYGLRENFYPCARWLDAIGAVRVMSRFAKNNGANNDKLNSATIKMITGTDMGRRKQT